MNNEKILNTDGTSDSRAFFLIPLNSIEGVDIKSYIAASKINDSSYDYRLYNKDSLSNIRPINDSSKQQLMNNLAVFGAFEKSVNNSDSVVIGGNNPGKFRNVTLKLGDSVKVNGIANSLKPNNMAVSFCDLTIDVYLSYYWQPDYYSYTYGNPGHWELSYASITITLTCYSFLPSGSEEEDDDSVPVQQWWQYGTGWPWINPLAYELQSPWSPWYTSNVSYLDPNSLSYREMQILSDLQEIKDDEQNNASNDCHGSKRPPGSTIFQTNATLAHLVIQEDYETNVSGGNGTYEYKIPGAAKSLSNYPGYADIANPISGEIFEIKPPSLQAEGAAEAAWYVSKANINCSPPVWTLGTNYPPNHILPNPADPSTSILASLVEPGVIIYTFPSRINFPVPVAAPQSVIDIIKELMRRRRENLNLSFPTLAMQYLKELRSIHSPALNNLKTALNTIAAGILIGYVMETIITEGGAAYQGYVAYDLAKDFMYIASTI